MSATIAEKPISRLRRRMLEDMAVRKLRREDAARLYPPHRDFAKFLGRSPDTATAEDVRRFQVHQTEQGAQPPKMNTQVSALRFFFTITMAASISPISSPA